MLLFDPTTFRNIPLSRQQYNDMGEVPGFLTRNRFAFSDSFLGETVDATLRTLERALPSGKRRFQFSGNVRKAPLLGQLT